MRVRRAGGQSRARGAAVLDALRAEACRRGAARASGRRPGSTSARARTAEIALSILAEIVAVRRAPRACRAGGAARPRAAPQRRPGVRHDGRRRRRDTPDAPATAAFCCEGCRDAWLARAGWRAPFVAGLVLAAGGSSRLGRPKQLLPYRGATLLDHVLATARACALRPAARRARRRGGRRARRASTCAAPRSSSTTATATGCSSSIAAAIGGARPARPTCSCCCSATSRASRRRRCARCWPAAATRRSPSAATRTAAATRSRSRARSSATWRALHGDKAVWKLLDRRADDVAEVPRARAGARATSTPGRTTRRCSRGDAVTPGARRRRRGAAVPDVAALARGSTASDYLADEGLATALFLSLRLPQPLLLEGEAGVGKTEAAKALAAALDTPLIRLQCYEGIDAAEALYEWNYPRQLLRIRLAEAGRRATLAEDDLFGARVPRPPARCCEAIEHPGPLPAVLLIDELDRADDDFEAFLLELLAEAAVTVPELGTIRAHAPARRGADLQPHARPARRAQAPLPVPLDRLPERRARGGDRPPARARRARRRSPPTSPRRVAAAARGRRPEAAGDRRGDRLGRGARAARRRAPRRGGAPSARSARCSSTARTRSSCARAGSSALVAATADACGALSATRRWPPSRSAARCAPPGCR